MIKKVFGRGTCKILFPLLLAFWLASCGLEEYYYIEPVPQGTINMANDAFLRLPSSSADGYSNPSYFEYFIIFYRIYITTDNETARIETDDQRRKISTTLQSDYNSLLSSTSTTSTSVNTNILTTFNNRNYYQLALNAADINSVLGSGSLGKTLEIHFSSNNGEHPILTLDGISYRLYRSNNGGVFTPEPDPRYFLNSSELYDSAKATAQINADVANIDSANLALSNGGAQRHTYVSMYIAALGQRNLTTFYSIPTFIGIFKLPQQ